MLPAFAEAGRALGRPTTWPRPCATPSSCRQMVRDGRLLRSWKDGQARITGYLEDYAMVGAGLLALYEATFDRRWLDESRAPRRGGAAPLLGRRARRLLRHRTRPGERSWSGRATSSTTRCRAAPRWPSSGCCGSPCSPARSATRRIALRGAPAHGRPHADATRRASAATSPRSTSTWARWPRWPWSGPRAPSAAAAPLLETVFAPLPAEPGGGRRAPTGAPAPAGLPLLAERGAVDGRADRVRVPALRLPAPGDRAGRARTPARRWGIIRIASLGEVS